ncbi:MAG: ABC transporter permease [Acidobacteria bacterium]|nr:ABC transporter permease [Acidobacteriota bacterium]
MRTLAFLKKTFLENLREWKILILALTFAPFFVYVMYAYFDATAPAYRLLVIDHDGKAVAGEPARADHARGLIQAWRAAAHPDGRPMFTVSETNDEQTAVVSLTNRDADLLVVIPEGFSRSVADYRDRRSKVPARLANHGDEGNLRASMAMAMSDFIAFGYVSLVTNAASPLELDIRRVGSGRTLSEFDLYVPALLVLAIIMVMFTAAASLIKEVDKGTMSRLVLSKLRTAELLAAVSVNQVLIGVTALALALGAAVSVGYRTDGSLTAVLAVGAASTLGVVALSVLVAAFLGSIYELLTVGCFPFFILMFFSEAMMPLPKVTMGHIASHALYANDLLPTSLGVRAFNRILNHGASLADVWFELAGILVLTAIYYAVGAILFARRHCRAA